MKLFKSKLKKRIETLEDYLGIHYIVDSDGYDQYVASEQSWGVINKIKNDIKVLKKVDKSVGEIS